MLQYRDNTKQYIKMLKKKHGALAIVGSHTCNEAAEKIKKEYDKELDKFIIRNKFTKGAVKLQKSSPQRKSGEFRKLTGINSKVGVRKLKGGKEHYLLLQEEGGTKRGVSQTSGKVPIPIDVTARKGGTKRGVIKGALQLQRAGGIQTLRLAGQSFGLPNDRFNIRQRWAILHKYTGTSRQGRTINRYGWDLKKQFYFTGMRRGFGIFKVQGKNRIHMIRSLAKSSVRIGARHGFQRSVAKLSQADMDRMFIQSAKRYLER